MGWSSISTVVGGGQLATAGGTPVQPVTDQLTSGDLGTGADGTVTLVANTTLVRDMQYAALTVGFSTTLNTASYVIRCQGVLENDGTIENNGGAAPTSGYQGAGAGAGGLGAPTGSLLGGADGVSFATGSVNWTPGGVGGKTPPVADVQGGAGGATTANVEAGGAVTPSGALGLSMAGLRSLRYAGGASGAVYTQGGSAVSSSGGAGGVVIAFCAGTAGSGSWHADAGAYYAQSEYVGGSGGGVVYIATRNRGDTWTLSAAGGAAKNGLVGFPGRTGVLVCNGS